MQCGGGRAQGRAEGQTEPPAPSRQMRGQGPAEGPGANANWGRGGQVAVPTPSGSHFQGQSLLPEPGAAPGRTPDISSDICPHVTSCRAQTSRKPLPHSDPACLSLSPSGPQERGLPPISATKPTLGLRGAGGALTLTPTQGGTGKGAAQQRTSAGGVPEDLAWGGCAGRAGVLTGPRDHAVLVRRGALHQRLTVGVAAAHVAEQGPGCGGAAQARQCGPRAGLAPLSLPLPSRGGSGPLGWAKGPRTWRQQLAPCVSTGVRVLVGVGCL